MKKIMFFLITISIFFVSCEDQDIHSIPLDLADETVIYGDSLKVIEFINNLYTYVPSGYGRFGNAMLSSVTDESVFSPHSTTISRWISGAWDATYIPDNVLASMYKGIRLTYVYRDKIHNNISDKVMGTYGRELVYSQVLFLRALFNFEILKRYGGYPIVDRLLLDPTEAHIARSNFDECVDYIAHLCDSAIVNLPLTLTDPNIGRATKGAAMALKSRLYLYAASKLYNNPDKPTNTVEHGTYNFLKWEMAAEAAADIINLKNVSTPIYSLSNIVNNFLFLNLKNPEVIFAKLSGVSNALEQTNAPVGLHNGGGGNCPTLDLVDAYYKQDGTNFDWNIPKDAQNPFLRRDLRFIHNILYNGSVYLDGYTVNVADDGADVTESINATKTGFYLRKFMSPTVKWWGTTATSPRPFVIFRYAETLLNYAEAMNELYGPDADPKSYGLTARDAIKLIRIRAGLKGNQDLSLYVPSGNKETMRQYIYRERQLELAFEEHRYFDLRRWRLAEEVLNKPVRGIVITRNPDNSYSYDFVEVENRVFLEKMYYYPFPLSELSRNNKLIQNFGW